MVLYWNRRNDCTDNDVFSSLGLQIQLQAEEHYQLIVLE